MIPTLAPFLCLSCVSLSPVTTRSKANATIESTASLPPSADQSSSPISAIHDPRHPKAQGCLTPAARALSLNWSDSVQTHLPLPWFEKCGVKVPVLVEQVSTHCGRVAKVKSLESSCLGRTLAMLSVRETTVRPSLSCLVWVCS